MRKLLKILTFTIVTLTAFVLIFKPELVRTMIPGILEKIYVTINNIIPIERGVDLKLSIIAVALIMPIFAGIMRSISDFNAAGIVGALMPFMLIIETGLVGILFGGFIIYVLFFVPSLFVVISYIYCCFLIFSDSVESWDSSSSSEYSSSGSSSSSSDSGTISNEEWWEVVDLTEHMKQEYGEDYFKDL